MKIPCICIDDKNRPKEIPQEKWVKSGEKYNVTWIFKQLNQPGVKGVELAEIDISMCKPYNSFRLSLFMFDINDFQKLFELFKETAEFNDVNIDTFVKDLIENEELILQE